MTGRTVVADGVVPTLCRQCEMHCGINVHIRDGRITKISGNPSHAENRGRVCAKAAGAVDLVYHPERLLTPLKKQPNGAFLPIPYQDAIDQIAAAVSEIRKRRGARAVGVWTGEAIGFFQQEAYARRFIHAFGSPNYFSAESLCYAARHIACYLVQGYYNACPDFANARTIVLWGANLGYSHPPYMWSIEQALEKGARLVVIDPRRTSIARRAHCYLQPLPGTDAALAWGVARQLINTGCYERQFVAEHCLGFEAFAAYAQRFSPAVVAAETGLDADEVLRLADLVAEGRPRVINYPGISMEHQPNGLNTVRIIAAITGLCGAVDRPGGDIWPEPMRLGDLTLYDCLPLEDRQPVGRDRFPALYDFRKQCHSMMLMDAILGRGDYRLTGLIVTGANPVLTNPNSAKVKEALGCLELLVVRDLFLTATAKQAHYVLPAASFLERSELFQHLHRQTVSLTRKVLDFDGLSDEYTFWRDLAHRLGIADAYFPWSSEEAVSRWLLQPAGLDLETLKAYPQGYPYAPVRFFKYRQRPFPTASGRFQFTSDYLKQLGHPELPEYVPPAVKPYADTAYPLVLITGARYRLYYHSRFRNIDRLRQVQRPAVEIAAQDANRLGIQAGEQVRVETRTGSIGLAAQIRPDSELRPGVIQIGHGWEEANVNLLTDDTDLDPISGYPNMKTVAARIVKYR